MAAVDAEAASAHPLTEHDADGSVAAAPGAGGSRRAWEIGAALALLALAAVAIAESVRIGAGYGFAGPETGFFPFWVSLPLVVAAAVSLRDGWLMRQTAAIFEDRDELAEFFKVGVPLALAVISLPWLGFYLATAAYAGFFTAWYGRYKWWVVLGATLLSPLVFYVVFERAFSLSLPKSVLYGPVFPI